MDGPASHWLLLHGAIVLVVGLLAGFPFLAAIVAGWGGETQRPWRVAHTVLVIDGMMLLLAGLVLPHAALGATASAVATWALVASAYGFVFALVGGAITGIRGLTPRPWGLNTVLYLGHAIGAAGSLVGTVLLAYGLATAL
jgi:hypothetical protein